MVVDTMGRRMVHSNAANDAINMFQNGTNCAKDLRISNKSRNFAEVFILEEFRRAPCAVIARGVLLFIWIKRLSILRKINFFLKK